MKARFICLAAAAAAASLVAASSALGVTTAEVSSTAKPNKSGSKKKPKPFNAKWHLKLDAGPGIRPAVSYEWKWNWNGVRTNGKHFPKCTREMIEAVQSDSVCPKKSLVGQTTFVEGAVGPTSDPTSFVLCEGKQISMYNAGKNAMTWLIVGPGSGCAGVGYLAPFDVKLKTKNKKQTEFDFINEEYLYNPLPGVDGGLFDLDVEMIDRKTKVKGKTVHYMESTGCKNRRTFTLEARTSEGTQTATADAGRCEK